jgi:hypothetical protein
MSYRLACNCSQSLHEMRYQNPCARLEATRKKAVRVSTLDQEAIMEEATKHDRLEYE